ncbi:MAG: glycine--tRNA ligase, partial [Candidatus Vogelbacteria bacterium]|nr:glycine--tRNA ligase [Candidatus Vogelbacteria bacterium]
LVALAKRRGFIYPGSEIYGGLAGTWDYGPFGVALKNNLKNSWWQKFVTAREDIYGVDAAILMNQKVWQASGHVTNFSDPLPSRFDLKDQKSQGRTFNTMFQTQIGAGDDAATSYLRPETAQGMFVNFKNIVDSFHPKLPFGIAQIGKAFRNEIAPRDFLFRVREFEQMEIEYFVRPEDWEKFFEYWRKEMSDWLTDIGLSSGQIQELEVPEGERAHYSKRTIDFEFAFPFGRKELCGLAYRADFDLKNHSDVSAVDLSYYNEETKERLMPHVIEPTFGLDRLILALLVKAYSEDELGGEPRIVLKLPARLAPVKVAVFPLLANKLTLVAKARAVFDDLKANTYNLVATFDDNGNIGKRYRRQDEIGTPWCVTIDFQTLEDDTVTIRDRDTGQQERVKIDELIKRLV